MMLPADTSTLTDRQSQLKADYSAPSGSNSVVSHCSPCRHDCRVPVLKRRTKALKGSRLRSSTPRARQSKLLAREAPGPCENISPFKSDYPAAYTAALPRYLEDQQMWLTAVRRSLIRWNGIASPSWLYRSFRSAGLCEEAFATSYTEYTSHLPVRQYHASSLLLTCYPAVQCC